MHSNSILKLTLKSVCVLSLHELVYELQPEM